MNARDYLHAESTEKIAEVVNALLPAIRGDVYLGENEQSFIRERMPEIQSSSSHCDFAVGIICLANYINSCR